MTSSTRGQVLASAAALGAVAGAVGAAAMTVGEKVEQAFTHRADSYIPARTLLTLLGRRPGEDERPALANHAMHWGTGAALGALRGLWSATGIRGAQANLLHTAARLAFDQTLENASGAGAPPATWPGGEQAVDVAHKFVYSVVTGTVSDRIIPPTLTSRRGTTSH